jgi:hypothetical protein
MLVQESRVAQDFAHGFLREAVDVVGIFHLVHQPEDVCGGERHAQPEAAAPNAFDMVLSTTRLG